MAHLFAVAFALALALTAWPPARANNAPAWLLGRSASELERESALASPVQLGAARFASQLFNGRPLIEDSQQQVDLFQCVDPSRTLFENFLTQYNRTFRGDSADKLERLNLFVTTLKRTIMLNRIIQNEILNQTNYELKPEIGNYHFILPTGAQNVAPWYADITDCELGLIKYIMFDIFYLLDKNEPALAYKVALDNSEYLPLLNEDGFEQLANILLIRLYDRFKGDEKMNQLFQWPLYLKKLAAYAYNRRQALQPDFNSKLALITYAYPSYFKDLKYNMPAINRTGDNLKAHQDHEKFNKLLNRKFSSRLERNRRLAIFRQRWTLVNLLNDDKRWQEATVQPDWLRAHQPDSGALGRSEKLRAQEDQVLDGRFKHTQFSDLTDAEFVAFLTNDFSLLENSKESAEFIDANFPIRMLDEKFKGEIASELELRRMVQRKSAQQDTTDRRQTRESLELAKRVVDELISDVGLPIGSVVVNDINENEHYSMFRQISRFFNKPYALDRANLVRNARFQSYQELSESDLSNERQLRYEQFKQNYGRFKAWFIKEGWQLDEGQLVAMLRLADMSWYEIKLTLFKICCLTEENLASLSSTNATIQYLGSNNFMCQQLNEPEGQRGNQDQDQARELAALELYYYYSVHFNKHHSNLDNFNQRFEIFKHNIDQIRRHSCTRGLTLYRSLKLKMASSLSTIDVLDPRRSYTDDINLDRYKYFTVPDLNAPESRVRSDRFDRLRVEPDEYSVERSGDGLSPSRAGVSYRREAFFSGLLEKAEFRAVNQANLHPSYAERLTNDAQNLNLSARKYQQNRISRIYDLVMQRYRYCMKTVQNIELSSGQLRQQCHSTGPLGDQAANGAIWNPDNQLNSANNLRLQQQDQCAFYQQGLEPWAEGLIKQDLLSAQLIQAARC